MAVNPLFSEKSLKEAFSKVKEDILNLKNEIDSNKHNITEQKSILNEILAEIKSLKPKIGEKSQNSPISEKVPQEMKGSSYSFIHSDIHSFTHSLNKQALNDLNQNLKTAFLALTKQEFLTFLTIYQLEEDLKRPVTYDDLATHLKLSKGCIRTYVSSLFNKNTPITKEKVNNKTVYLSLLPDFRELNLKNKLFQLYSNQDPDQKRLMNDF